MHHAQEDAHDEDLASSQVVAADVAHDHAAAAGEPEEEAHERWSRQARLDAGAQVTAQARAAGGVGGLGWRRAGVGAPGRRRRFSHAGVAATAPRGRRPSSPRRSRQRERDPTPVSLEAHRGGAARWPHVPPPRIRLHSRARRRPPGRGGRAAGVRASRAGNAGAAAARRGRPGGHGGATGRGRPRRGRSGAAGGLGVDAAVPGAADSKRRARSRSSAACGHAPREPGPQSCSPRRMHGQGACGARGAVHVRLGARREARPRRRPHGGGTRARAPAPRRRAAPRRQHSVLHPGEGRDHDGGLADLSREHAPVTLQKGVPHEAQRTRLPARRRAGGRGPVGRGRCPGAGAARTGRGRRRLPQGARRSGHGHRPGRGAGALDPARHGPQGDGDGGGPWRRPPRRRSPPPHRLRGRRGGRDRHGHRRRRRLRHGVGARGHDHRLARARWRMQRGGLRRRPRGHPRALGRLVAGHRGRLRG